MDDLESDAQRAERFKRWLAGFGFSAEDWARIRELAYQVRDHYNPRPLTDLSVPLRVAATPARLKFCDGFLGYITQPAGRKVAISFWRLDGHEADNWAAARAQREAKDPDKEKAPPVRRGC